MINIVEQEEAIQKKIMLINKQFQNLNSKQKKKKNAAHLKIKKFIKDTILFIQAYQYDLISGNLEGKNQHYRKQIQQIEKKMEKLQQSNQLNTQNEFNQQKEQNKQQLINKGHKIQQKSKDVLRLIIKDVQQGNKQLDNINMELNRQIQALDKVYQDTKDTQSTLKRAQKHLRYFAKQVYTDKILICLIVLVTLAIIAVIIMSFVKGKDTPSQDSS